MAEEKQETWEDVQGTSNVWLPVQPKESIEGVIKELKQGQYGAFAVILGKDQEWTTPSHKVLQTRLVGCKIGDYVKITYEKEELPTIKGRNPTKIYSVKRKLG